MENLERLYTEREALAEGAPEGPTKAQPAAVIAAQWDAADNSERRAMLTKALGGSTLFLDKYVKRPGPRVFDRNRLRLVEPQGIPVTTSAATPASGEVGTLADQDSAFEGTAMDRITNPGTGPLPHALVEVAETNMVAFADDVCQESATPW